MSCVPWLLPVDIFALVCTPTITQQKTNRYNNRLTMQVSETTTKKKKELVHRYRCYLSMVVINSESSPSSSSSWFSSPLATRVFDLFVCLFYFSLLPYCSAVAILFAAIDDYCCRFFLFFVCFCYCRMAIMCVLWRRRRRRRRRCVSLLLFALVVDCSLFRCSPCFCSCLTA